MISGAAARGKEAFDVLVRQSVHRSSIFFSAGSSCRVNGSRGRGVRRFARFALIEKKVSCRRLPRDVVERVFISGHFLGKNGACETGARKQSFLCGKNGGTLNSDPRHTIFGGHTIWLTKSGFQAHYFWGHTIWHTKSGFQAHYFGGTLGGTLNSGFRHTIFGGHTRWHTNVARTEAH